MNLRYKIWVPILIGLILVITTITKWLTKASPQKHLYLTSDIHLSSPKGRWPDKRERYRRFIDSIEEHPEVIIQVGGFIDSAIQVESGVTRGGRKNWLEELEIYRSTHEKLKQSGVEILDSYGTGHDFWSEESLKEAESITGVKRRGAKKWERSTLIWITTRPGSFSPDGPHDPVMEDEKYEWLNDTLENNRYSILLFHVPIKTSESIKHSEFGNGHDLTIPQSDPSTQSSQNTKRGSL